MASGTGPCTGSCYGGNATALDLPRSGLLAGALPSEGGFLALPESSQVSFDWNKLRGTLASSEIGELTGAKRLTSTRSKLSGSTIPTEIARLVDGENGIWGNDKFTETSGRKYASQPCSFPMLLLSYGVHRLFLVGATHRLVLSSSHHHRLAVATLLFVGAPWTSLGRSMVAEAATLPTEYGFDN